MIVTPADGQIPYSPKAEKLARLSAELEETAFDGPEQRPTSERCLAGIGQAPIRTAACLHSDSHCADAGRRGARRRRMSPPCASSTSTAAAPPPDALTHVRRLVGRPLGWRHAGGRDHAQPRRRSVPQPSRPPRHRRTRQQGDRALHASSPIASCSTSSPSRTPTSTSRRGCGEYVFARSDKVWYEYACHEGNYAMVNMLRGRPAGAPASEKELSLSAA